MTDSSSFDVKDPKHQVSSDHPPDKASTWTIPLDTDRWVLTHDAIRAELDAMKGALAAMAERKEGKLSDWAATSLNVWWAGHSRHVLEHCAKEEEMLVPFVSERIEWPENLKEEHGELETWRGEFGKIARGLPENGATVTELRAAWEAYESRLRPHLLEEERTALPLVRAYFSQEEVSPVGRKMMEAEPETTVGAMVHAMGEDKFRSVFMKQQGIPFFVWHVAFKGRHATYRKEMAAHVEALKVGSPPAKEKKSGWGLF